MQQGDGNGPKVTQVRRILLVYPEFEPTYWGMQHFLPMVGKKALMPPLGLITVAALTPPGYEFRLVDLNCRPLSDEDIAWADVVCFSAMLFQKRTLFKAARRCRDAGKLVVFGGPYPTACPEECTSHCDVLVLNEGENTWPAFISDLEQTGRCRSVYTSAEKPGLANVPVPRMDLLNTADYLMIPVQFSRGCPYLCEFCDIIVMFGRKPRTKSPGQMIAELEAVYATGHRGTVFIVDDNFIGNKRAVKNLLPRLSAWNRERGYPFVYGTEASIDLADDHELLRLMTDANFAWVFIGLESPEAESLKEARKTQNLRSPLLDSVKTIQSFGLTVHGGFIIGFDHDDETIFDRQIGFISETAIPFAMIGPLDALPGTPLHARMGREGRLLPSREGDEDRLIGGYRYTNIKTVMPQKAFFEGYRTMLETLYSPRAYFSRVGEMLFRLPSRRSLRRAKKLRMSVSLLESLGHFLRALRKLPWSYLQEALRLAWKTYRNRPDQLFRVLPYAMLGVHYYRYTFETIVPDLTRMIDKLPESCAITTDSRASCGVDRSVR
jgi:radical SAM superfamily enzyme YgiQ (UPF0313 family)